MDMKETFGRLGLPKHSDAVYRTLEKRGGMLATDICTVAKLHRPAAYRALAALEARHFIFHEKKGKRKFYHAASPVLIANAFSKTSTEVAKRMAEKAVADEQYRQKEIRFLDGFKGIRAAFDDAISHSKRGETFYRYTSEKDLDAVNRYLSKDYRARRDQKKLERMVISNPISGKRKKPRLERFVKYIPEEASLFDQNIIQLIYGDRISLIDLNAERVLIIENKALADFQKVIFRQLYDKLPLP
ncbi:MAG: helix-turn-helix domain-containing protein [Candidatus Moranbacteria bacterium]|nr:helix-turn-helix domain-containing protein [Candidatus Moranbacteria bacterium]